MKKITLVICFFCLTFVAKAQTTELFFEQASIFLKKNVTPQGKVDYFSIKKSPGELVYILTNIEKIDTKFSDNKVAKAFWINVYNLRVIKSVVDRFPIESVEKIPGFFNAESFVVGNQELTLDDIEHVILRDLFFDPAIHFVLTSASVGGGPLLNAAYLPATVEEQIKARATFMLNSRNYFIVDKENNTIQLPKIFEWYKKDFAVNYFNEIDFINLFLEKKIDNKLKITYYDFNWALNKA